MKKICPGIMIAIILGCFGNKVAGQIVNKVTCIAQVKKDSVVLRWVPSSIPVWQTGIRFGYFIKRYTIAKGGVYIPDGLSQGILLNSVPIKPASIYSFDILALSEPRSIVVQDAVYGSEFQSITVGNDFKSFIKAYNNLEVKFGFALFMCDLSPPIARAAGLRFTDKNVLSDERYAYSISLANIPDGLPVDPAVVVLDAGLITKLPPVKDVQAIFLNKAVRFQWPVLFHKGIYTAYILEKSTDGDTYMPVSDLPLMNLSENENPDYFVFTDSLKTNSERNWYRVKGISPFGEEGPSSDAVIGKSAPDFTAYAVIDKANVIDNKKIILEWMITERETSPVTGIVILRSFNPDGVYKNLTPKPLPPESRSFTDVHPGISNYYKVMLYEKDKIISQSFPFLIQTEDNDPPAAPVFLIGKVDSSGIVMITWKSNIEPDILGYKVFMANARDEESFSLERDILMQNLYYDTINLNTLTRKICYQVIAVDKSYNNSDYSAILELTRPDTIAPAPAIITKIDLTDGAITLHQEGSPSEDIGLYELYRNDESDSIFRNLAVWKGNLPGEFTDVPAGKGRLYKYLIKTTDISGNHSEYMRNIYVPNSVQKKIELRADKEKNGKSIILSWEVPLGFIQTKAIIYRSKNTEAISIYTMLEGYDNLFADSDVEVNTSYNYRIKVFGHGNEFVNSDVITFRPVTGSKQEIKPN